MAIGVSIAIHAVAAWGLISLRPAVEFAPQRAMSVQLVATPPRFEPAPVLRAPALLEPRAMTESAGTPAPEAVPATAPPAQSPSRRSPASASVPQAVVRTAEAELADYRQRVWAHLAARAPSARAGSGTTTVMFGLDESGAILFVRLVRSSGRPAFDRACLAAVRAAAPLPPPPTGTARDDLVFTIPIKAADSFSP